MTDSFSHHISGVDGPNPIPSKGTTLNIITGHLEDMWSYDGNIFYLLFQHASLNIADQVWTFDPRYPRFGVDFNNCIGNNNYILLWIELSPPPGSFAETLTRNTSECDLIWK